MLGQGWLFSALPDGQPSREVLDAVRSDRPVYLDANDHHSVWVNTLALQELGITRDTPEPVGGRIGKHVRTGEPTGHIDETAMQDLVWPFLTEQRTDGERDQHLAAALEAYATSGITGVVDMAVDQHTVAAVERAMLGDSRVERGYAWPEFSDSGARLAFGTDAPTAPHSALANLFIATTRR